MSCEIEHYCPNCSRSFPVNLESRLALAEAVVEASRDYQLEINDVEPSNTNYERMREALAAYDKAKGET